MTTEDNKTKPPEYLVRPAKGEEPFSFAAKGRVFGVTTLGEAIRRIDGEDDPTFDMPASVNIAELCRKLGLDWESSVNYRNDPDHPLSRAAEKFWQDNAERAMTPEELAAWRHVNELQHVNSDRFRVYGGLVNDRPVVSLVTEFLTFRDRYDVWDRVRHIAETLGAAVRIMHEHPHLDRVKYHGDEEWTVGADDGRVERQVEMLWRVEEFNRPSLAALLKILRKGTKEIWKPYGVSVV